MARAGVEATEPRLKIMIVDDDPKLRAAWERLLNSQPAMQCTGSLASADALIAALKEKDTDLVLMDLTMPGKDPLVVIEELARAQPKVKVVVFSGYTDEDTVRRAIDAGAWAVVDKLCEPMEILDVLRRVAGGEVVLPRQA